MYDIGGKKNKSTPKKKTATHKDKRRKKEIRGYKSQQEAYML
jgi:hypothetical protein